MIAESVNDIRLVNEKIGEVLSQDLRLLDTLIDGDIFIDLPSRLMYATDASAYRELPLAVCRPRHSGDIKELVAFARKRKITLIPRAAGTSLAGQVVGRGLVVDISRYMCSIKEINSEENWVTVEPGVILDDLNKELAQFGLFFSPETSTSSRCMIGGMVGNNSSGLHSLVYGTTREHLISLNMILSDGSEVIFEDLDRQAFEAKCELDSLEGEIYRNIKELINNPENITAIEEEFPDPGVVRRNTGYALDELLSTSFITGEGAKHKSFNFSRLIAGSEGTLGFITEAKLHLDPLPPPIKALVPVHVDSVLQAIRGNLIALRHKPSAVELMDKTILDLTEGNITQKKNRFFLKGSPGAILIVEFFGDSRDEIHARIAKMEADFRLEDIGYHFPVIEGDDILSVWALRKAGLGVLSKMKGDAKPVSVIEDTSVIPSKLESYIDEFNLLLQGHQLECVYHAHISVGELHLRPILNLKDSKDVELFHTIARETALLVKKYRGSLSGEHGDGRLRGEFIPLMVGERNFQLMRSIKQVWDSEGIFNAGKIIDSPPMNTFLRFKPGQISRDIDTIYDFSEDGGILRHIEQCNGSGDCRKTEKTGGTMCPSYMASLEERNTTRARANILREFIGKQGDKGVFDHREAYEILDLCLSCKACKSECPSSIDMAKLKSEFMQHWYDNHGIPLRSRVIAYIASINKFFSPVSGIFNFLIDRKLISSIVKGILGFAKKRSIPSLSKQTLNRWCKRELGKLNSQLAEDANRVWFFVDEFTNYNDAQIGIKAIRLLHKLGIRVEVRKSSISGRTFLSKGFVRTARKHARKNVQIYKDIVSQDRPLLGLEPSAILGFRDEYPELVGDEMKKDAELLAPNCLMIEEYISRLYDSGLIDKEKFTKASINIRLHGHCQQKAIASTKETLRILSIPENYVATEIPSGCCGMAGSFGYEKEHYDLSMKVGELVLFPEIRKAGQQTIIAAAGTSCRHQISDGTGVKGKHPVEILYEAMSS